MTAEELAVVMRKAELLLVRAEVNRAQNYDARALEARQLLSVALSTHERPGS